MKRLYWALLIAAAGYAQTQQAAPPRNASISGVVRSDGGDQPLAGLVVSTATGATWIDNAIIQGPNYRQVSDTSDAQGRYSLKDLPPGNYQVVVRQERGGYLTTRMATLAAGQELTLDLVAGLPGAVAGKVVDDNKEPMPGVEVWLVAREYYLGATRYFMQGTARTDDQGQYVLEGVTPGKPYLIMTRKRVLQLPSVSDEPADPKLRRQAFAPTFYPGSLAAEGGMPVILRPGERREGVDIQVRRTPSLCLEGATQPAIAARVEIVEDQPSAGASSSMGLFVVDSAATVGEDGKFRFCGLHPGAYRVTARQMSPDRNAPPAQFGVVTATLRDEDVRDFRAPLQPGMPLNGEFVWEGSAPADAQSVTVSLSLGHLYSAQFRGEELYARGAVPSAFTLKNVVLDQYAVRAFINGPGLYIKDVTYGGFSVLHAPLRMGSAAAGAGVKVIVARDAGGVSGSVKEGGKPAGGATVYIIPADVRSEPELQARRFTAQPDQNGDFGTGLRLAPGKYHAIAARTPVDASPEGIARLWTARAKAKEIEVQAGKTVEVALELAPVD